MGRYLHQGPQFRRRPRRSPSWSGPSADRRPSTLQIDFKLASIGRIVIRSTCTRSATRSAKRAWGLASFWRSSGPSAPSGHGRTSPRGAAHHFARWGTLPDEVQTDGEAVLIGRPQDTFPSPFTLWLRGLGITHLRIRPGKPTDNAEVERCHRTVTIMPLSAMKTWTWPPCNRPRPSVYE